MTSTPANPMTVQELSEAASKIALAAQQTRNLAAATKQPSLANARRGVAQQLQDRADQVRSWATITLHRERHSEETPPDVARTIAAATREFLEYARWE